jgi:hypothetical protein
MTIELPAIPGRKARQAVVALRFGAVVVSRPKNSRPNSTPSSTAGASEMCESRTANARGPREDDSFKTAAL